MTATVNRVPWSPLTAAALHDRATDEFARSGRWVAYWLRNDLSIREHRDAWARAERYAARGAEYAAALRLRDHGGDAPAV